MFPDRRPRVAVIDYGMGNLFSVEQACAHVGLAGRATTDPHDVAAADAVVLPGVGAFGDAMSALRRLDLVSVLSDVAASGRPLLGICLGLQLLMDESSEFGAHKGLGLVPGVVRGLVEHPDLRPATKVPHVGWNRLRATSPHTWAGSLLAGFPDGGFMHFVHSFYVVPENPEPVIAETEYGGVSFCSALQHGHIFACQAHPERSAMGGLIVYENLARTLTDSRSIDGQLAHP